jgi:hypothetical protein
MNGSMAGIGNGEWGIGKALAARQRKRRPVAAFASRFDLPAICHRIATALGYIGGV